LDGDQVSASAQRAESGKWLRRGVETLTAMTASAKHQVEQIGSWQTFNTDDLLLEREIDMGDTMHAHMIIRSKKSL
jgi:hypothetical protein